MTTDEAVEELNKKLKDAKVKKHTYSDGKESIHILLAPMRDDKFGVDVYKQVVSLDPIDERWGFVPVLLVGGEMPYIYFDSLEKAVWYVKIFINVWGK